MLGVAIWRMASGTAPVYEGKTDADWLTAARSADPRWRERAAYALTQVAPARLPAYDAVLATESHLLADRDQDVRTEAADGLLALAASRHDTARIVSVLLAMLHRTSDSDAWVDAMRALGRLGPAASPAIPTLRELLSAGSPAVRSAAIDVLADLGPRDVELLASFGRMAEDSDAAVRQAALGALTRSGAEGALVEPIAIRWLDDPDPGVREQAAYTLVALRPVPAAAVDPLARHLNDPASEVRLGAASALAAALPDQAARTALQRAADDPDSVVSRPARAALYAAGLGR